jgi:hypothetical protein
MVSQEDQITIDRRFKEAVESDPWASTDFLLNQFQKLAKQPIVIGSNTYNISSYSRMHPDIDETTDLVLRAETYDGKTLFAKADVSEHFITLV